MSPVPCVLPTYRAGWICSFKRYVYKAVFVPPLASSWEFLCLALFYWTDQKVHSGFSIWKTQTNFLANPIHILASMPLLCSFRSQKPRVSSHHYLRLLVPWAAVDLVTHRSPWVSTPDRALPLVVCLLVESTMYRVRKLFSMEGSTLRAFKRDFREGILALFAFLLGLSLQR